MPDIREMPGQSSRHKEQGVNPNVIAIASVARCQPLGGDGDATQPIFIERPGGRVLATSLLDLDERQDAASPGDQIDFAARYAGSLRKDSPAAEAQPPGGDGLRLAAARLRLLPVQSPPPSSRARA